MAPTLALQKGDILLTQTSSLLGIELDNAPFLSGLVELICETSDAYEVGDVVLFDPLGATMLKYGGIDYYLTQESKVKYQELPAP